MPISCRGSLCVLLSLTGSLCTVAIAQDPAGAPNQATELEALRNRVESLEKLVGQNTAEVDLSDESVSLDSLPGSKSVLARPWYENLNISGFIAVDYLKTGEAATRRDGGFALRETSLFVEADVTEDISAFFEIRTDYKAANSFGVTTGEVYCHLRNVIGSEGCLNLKIGRFNIPFSEEYLLEHPTDNALILNSAHWWYGTDEGILAYGKIGDLGWVGAIMDGSAVRNNDDGSELATSLKVYGNITKQLFLSGSVFRNGKTARSGLRFSGSDFRPVGAGGSSTAGVSPSSKVDAWAYAIDGRFDFSDRNYLMASFGQAWVDDSQPAFDREFLWYSVEARHQLINRLYLAGRFSSIGTFDRNEGYQFEGTITAGGDQAFGYDTRELQRLQVGLGWQHNPHTLVKFEAGYDRFVTIDASPADPNNDERWFLGAELVVSF